MRVSERRSPEPRPLTVRDGGVVAHHPTKDEYRFFQGWQPIPRPIRMDEEESGRVGRRIRALPCQCWFNARKVVQRLDEYADASYVEGIAVVNGGLLIEHGWVIRRDGTVIDPTLPRRCVAYFPGLEFVGRAGIDQYLATSQGAKCRRSPFFYAFGWGGSYSPSYSAAWNKAMAFQERVLANKEVS